jgi:3-oxoacyl-[acyl-carrier protein] reductase
MSSNLTSSYAGQVALVTGAAQGIGATIAKFLKEAGATVHLTDIDAVGVEVVAKDLGVDSTVADLGDRDEVHALIDGVIEKYKRLDILVHAGGGVCGQVGRSITEITEEDWHIIFKANVDAAFWLAQAAGPKMVEAGYGRIVYIASGAGLRPSLTGIQAYTSAKHALVGLTKQLSLEFGKYGVTCNAVAPGFVLSNPSTKRQWAAMGDDGQQKLMDSIHTGRLGSPQDIANAVMFFTSKQADWVSGQILSVDGGRS